MTQLVPSGIKLRLSDSWFLPTYKRGAKRKSIVWEQLVIRCSPSTIALSVWKQRRVDILANKFWVVRWLHLSVLGRSSKISKLTKMRKFFRGVCSDLRLLHFWRLKKFCFGLYFGIRRSFYKNIKGNLSYFCGSTPYHCLPIISLLILPALFLLPILMKSLSLFGISLSTNRLNWG